MTDARATNVPSNVRCRVVVTGVGVYTSIGSSPGELLDSIRTGHCGIGVIQGFDVGQLEIRHGAEILNHDPMAHFSADEAASLDRTAQFAVIAARQAVANAKLEIAERAHRVGVVMGICAGGQGLTMSEHSTSRPWDDAAAANRLLGAAHYVQTDAVVKALGARGPQTTVSTACASSGTALGHAFQLLQTQKVDAVIAGGADAFTFQTYAGFYALGAMCASPCSPFGDAIGVTFGEGAGCVVLERLTDAIDRGAPILGELIGFGTTADAYHVTSPHPTGEGLCRAMRLALDSAGLERESIDYINAHGTGTRDNDLSETLAIKALYRDAKQIPPVSSTKSFFGHTLGAAGALEFIVSLLCGRENIIPPTIHLRAPRPGCDLDYVPNEARSAPMHHFLTNSAAFGGVNAVLVGGEVAPTRSLPPLAHDAIVITGLAVVSAVGCGLDEFRTALREGRSGITDADRPGAVGPRAKRAALVHDFLPRRLVPSVDVRRMDRLNQYAVVAAGLGLADAGLDGGRLSEERVGVVVGLTRGPDRKSVV